MGHGAIGKLAAATVFGLAGLVGSAWAGAEMPTGPRATQPIGHYEFCQQNRADCSIRSARTAAAKLTPDLWAQLIDVNNLVNVTTLPRTDMELWGREEVWSYPTHGAGDCEDYVLEKRRQLMKAGMAATDLLITVVRQPDGAGHAVLTVRTDRGDFILDNLEPRILLWNQTDYTFLKRQSARDSGAWVAVEDGRSVAVGSVR